MWKAIKRAGQQLQINWLIAKYDCQKTACAALERRFGSDHPAVMKWFTLALNTYKKFVTLHIKLTKERTTEYLKEAADLETEIQHLLNDPERMN